MKDKFYQQARHEYSPNQRLIALICLAPVFLLILPWLFVSLGRGLDQRLGWPPFPAQPANLILGLLLALPSFLFAFWSIYSQFTLGRGTPVPLMATQQLVVQPPYTYCRNPMALGTIGAYLGVAVLFQSIGAAVLVLFLVSLLLIYIWRVEEKEMVTRFGQDYLDYRRRTPFLIPRLTRRG